MKLASLPVCRESLLLFTLCAADMVSSAWLFHHRMAVEANPLLRMAAESGTLSFMLLKSASFVPALLFAEWYRRRRPDFVVRVLRSALAVYAAVYALLVGGQLLR